MSIRFPFLAVLLIVLNPAAHADDLGVVGPTYDIAERDLLEVIESRLKQLQQTGQLATKQNEYRDRVISAIEQPKPAAGVKATVTRRSFFVDPTWVLDRKRAAQPPPREQLTQAF